MKPILDKSFLKKMFPYPCKPLLLGNKKFLIFTFRVEIDSSCITVAQ